MKNLIFVGLLGLFLSACGGYTSPANNTSAGNNANAVNTANTAANTNTSTNTAANTANTNANTNANTAKPAAGAPARIVFVKGATQADQSITLAPGASKQFVVGAKKGQFLTVDPNDDKITKTDLKITLVTKGKSTMGDLSEFLSATLNADGDYVFEVKNISKKAITIPLHIQIDDGPQ